MIKHLACVVAALFCAVAAAQIAPSVWPKFRGDLANSGVGTGFSATNQVLWSQTVSPNTGIQSSPVVAVDGTVFIGSSSYNRLLALDGKTGSILWSYVTGGPITGSAAVQQDGSVCFGSGDGKVYSVNGSTGALLWAVKTGGAVKSSPTIDAAGTVYVGSQDNKLYALKGSTGEVKWTFKGGGEINSSAAIAPDGTVYVGCSDGSVYALNPTDGSIKWFFVSGGAVVGSPSVAPNGTVVIGSEDQNVYGLRGSSGKVLWKFVTNGLVDASPGISTSGTAVVGSQDGNVYGIRAVDGARQWVFQTGGPVNSSASFSNSGLIYVGSNDGFVYCLKPSGALAWKYSTGRAIESSPTPGADGTMYVGSHDGALYAFATTYPGPRPASLALSPSTIPAGMPCQGTVTLDHPALYGGAVVKLVSSQSFAVVPNSVTVPYGVTTTTFPIATSTTGTNSSVKISCSANGQTVGATLSIGPPRLVSISISPDHVLGGDQSSGTVTLSSTARAGGIVVSLTSSTSSIVAPSAITVPSGQASTTFSIRTLGVAQDRMGQVTATSGGHSASAALTVKAATLISIQVQPVSVAGGQSVTGTVSLNGPAPSGGAAVRLHATASYVSMPATVVVPAGKPTATFTVRTISVPAVQNVVILGTYLNGEQSCTLAIQPPDLTGVSLKPSSVKGGNNSIATVTLSSAAPVGGLTLKVSSNFTLIGVPSKVVVPGGRMTVQFTVKTTKTGSPSSGTVSVFLGSTRVSAQLSLTP